MKMKQKVFTYSLVLLLIILVQSLFAEVRQVREDQIIVKVKSSKQIDDIALDYNLIVSDSIYVKKTFLLNIPDDRELSVVIDLLNDDKRVLNVSENATVGLPEVFQISQGFPDENRPVFNLGVEPINFYEQSGNYSIGIDSAQVLSKGEGVVVAVIDNGLAIEHPLFEEANIVFYHDYITGNNNQNINPPNTDHGTFVTGLILLTAPECTIMPIRAFDENGISDQFTLTKSINWAINHGADIINLSFGTSILDEPLMEAFEDAHDNGIIMVAASGNDSSNVPLYPASLDHVIAVGSVNAHDSVSVFSNYGAHLDLVSPGESVYSALSGEYEWGTWSGTSFAAPFVTGTIALMQELNDSYSHEEISDHLRNTTTTNLIWGNITTPDLYYGYGILNAFEAVVQLTLGDFDVSGQRNIKDLSTMIDIATNAGVPDGVVPQGRYDYNIKMRQADVNCDGIIDMQDVSYMSDYIFIHVMPFSPCFNR